MKLVSYKFKQNLGDLRIGFIINEKVYDIQEGYRQLLIFRQEEDLANAVDTVLPADPDRFFSIGESAIERAAEAYNYIRVSDSHFTAFHLEDLYLSNPVLNPSKIICVGKNYADHVAEMKSDLPEYPVLFAKFNNALIGPEDAIEKPEVTTKLDYEVELAVVIGKETSKVSQEDALDYVAGYTIGNDISARDLQKRTPQWLQGKTLDRSTPIGPWVVTSDEMTEPSDLAIRSYVNGEVRQSSTTSNLIFDVPYLIEFISNLITLKPGDIILTGTPDGVGFAMDPPQYLTGGDVVTLEIENIGKMVNKVQEPE
ncbi:acylpyruvate hydrolase [Virgibacillus natechei]|uniref:Acylpyruvate hydrolase n=1 Tax=Virgibacillus natechei TaxID=1216297 RepID=A0ABS4IER9_9BACI|nr:fumarylacetoacetate hydrolase family protein [Virgibacillus natechei]MBP1969434.1 acylpyruvate hydrolase [Virgibacillus natechei]UZD11855.1 fumarylacetoacetate hydrolase family protein [Virgibacillus natechei]